jgi:hypothetical protein
MVPVLTREADRPTYTPPHSGAEVTLGAREDGTPTADVQVFLRGASGSRIGTVFVLEDPDLAEALAHALLTAADHLRAAL